jgi:hypothetical protein
LTAYGKGGVEGEVGFFRRNHLVPVPSARNLDELNAMLLAGCREDEARTIDGRQVTVGEALAIERDHLLPMPSEGFDLVEVSFAHVDGLRRRVAALRATGDPMGVSRTYSTWSTTWTYLSGSPARWLAASRWSNGVKLGGGRRVTTACGRR